MNNLIVQGKAARFLAEAVRHYITCLQGRMAQAGADGQDMADIANDIAYCQSLARILDRVGAWNGP